MGLIKWAAGGRRQPPQDQCGGGSCALPQKRVRPKKRGLQIPDELRNGPDKDIYDTKDDRGLSRLLLREAGQG